MFKKNRCKMFLKPEFPNGVFYRYILVRPVGMFHISKNKFNPNLVFTTFAIFASISLYFRCET